MDEYSKMLLAFLDIYRERKILKKFFKKCNFIETASLYTDIRAKKRPKKIKINISKESGGKQL